MPDFAQPLYESEVDRDPFRQFAAWFAEAGEAMRAPEAAALATATPDGSPSVRIVLVKQADEHGFVFFTNYESRKSDELAANPRAALLFHWDALGRQVRAEGSVVRVTSEETADYVGRRPRASQISALASPQSQPVESRDVLEQRVSELRDRYEGQDLPAPGNWGGFRLTPVTLEFWQHREDRLHDRLLYLRGDQHGGWRMQRLAP